jgi:hypothetical protein
VRDEDLVECVHTPWTMWMTVEIGSEDSRSSDVPKAMIGEKVCAQEQRRSEAKRGVQSM